MLGETDRRKDLQIIETLAEVFDKSKNLTLFAVGAVIRNVSSKIQLICSAVNGLHGGEMSFNLLRMWLLPRITKAIVSS